MSRERKLQLIGLVAASAGSRAALADGGISSLAGLRPVFLAFFVLAVGVLVWLVLSLLLLFLAPAQITNRKLNLYRAYTSVLIGVMLAAALVSTSFLTGFVLLGALVVSAIIGALTVVNLGRAKRRAPHLDA